MYILRNLTRHSWNFRLYTKFHTSRPKFRSTHVLLLSQPPCFLRPLLISYNVLVLFLSLPFVLSSFRPLILSSSRSHFSGPSRRRHWNKPLAPTLSTRLLR